jgi:drug/metabolite transporter (DMT)-like permease
MLKRFINTQNLAVLSLLYSASLWGLIWYPLQLWDDSGMSPVWASLVMYCAASAVSLPWLFNSYVQIKGHLKDLTVLVLSASYTNLAFLVALNEGEIMRVILLFYLSPLWSVMISRVWLGERLSPKAWGLFLIAIIGSLIMLWNPQLGMPWPHGSGDWLALSAGFAFAVNIVSARKMAEVAMSVKTIAIWWGVAIFSGLVLVFQGSALPQVSLTVWSSAVLFGALGMVSMNIAVLYGLAKMPVYRSSVIMLFELIVAAASAWLLIGESMSLQEWLGGMLILMSGTLLVKLQAE